MTDNEDDFSDADTDRYDISRGPARGDEKPAVIRFILRNIRSLNADCLFCKKPQCDQIFMLRSMIPGKTRAYAVHSSCVFDHEQLQDLGAGLA